MKTSEPPIIIEQTFPCPLEKVWRAITDPAQMRQWYFEQLPDFQPVLGFKTRFDVEGPERTFPHVWEITEVVPGEKIVYNWHYEEYTGDSEVTFELQAQGDTTRLRLTHTVLADFPDHIPEFARESGVQGWTFLITERLAAFLEKR